MACPPGIHYYTGRVKYCSTELLNHIPIDFSLEGILPRGQSPPNKTLLVGTFVQALTINDLQHVYEKLENASPHWFNLGLALGLTHLVLTNINIQYHQDSMSCLREMLAKLLGTQHVTWSLLSDALKKPTVHLTNLADSITGNYFSVCASFNFASVGTA